jgi:hypothetical protein
MTKLSAIDSTLLGIELFLIRVSAHGLSATPRSPTGGPKAAGGGVRPPRTVMLTYNQMVVDGLPDEEVPDEEVAPPVRSDADAVGAAATVERCQRPEGVRRPAPRGAHQ